MDGHRGRLFVEGNRHGLDAGVSIDNKHLHVRTDGDTWTWPIRDVVLRRWQGNQFKLKMGKEEFLFTAEDPITFTFEVVDHLNSGSFRSPPRRRPGSRTKSMAAATRPGGTVSEVVTRDPIPASVAPGDVWTELATGRDEATLLEALSELSHVGKHRHRLEEGDDHGDGVVQLCTQCNQVFIDLIAAESPDKSDPWASLE